MKHAYEASSAGNRSAKAALALLAGLMLSAGPTTAAAQDYPTRSVRLVLPFGTGGSTDAIALLVSQKMSESLGQQVVAGEAFPTRVFLALRVGPGCER